MEDDSATIRNRTELLSFLTCFTILGEYLLEFIFSRLTSETPRSNPGIALAVSSINMGRLCATRKTANVDWRNSSYRNGKFLCSICQAILTSHSTIHYTIISRTRGKLQRSHSDSQCSCAFIPHRLSSFESSMASACLQRKQFGWHSSVIDYKIRRFEIQLWQILFFSV